jgi:hypothetical protein
VQDENLDENKVLQPVDLALAAKKELIFPNEEKVLKKKFYKTKIIISN